MHDLCHIFIFLYFPVWWHAFQINLMCRAWELTVNTSSLESRLNSRSGILSVLIIDFIYMAAVFYFYFILCCVVIIVVMANLTCNVSNLYCKRMSHSLWPTSKEVRCARCKLSSSALSTTPQRRARRPARRTSSVTKKSASSSTFVHFRLLVTKVESKPIPLYISLLAGA